MEHMPTKTVALTKLKLSEKNVRTNVADATDINELSASILAHGLLNPLVVVAEGKGFAVIAGGRRFRALCDLVRDGHLSSDAEVPVVIAEAENAEEISLVENFVRKAMRPYEVFRAFKLALDAKPELTDTDLAARFGLPVNEVRKHLRLGNLHPQVFDLFAAGQINEEQAQAFASTADHALQIMALDRLDKADRWGRDARAIRSWIGVGDFQQERNLERVGREIYEAAGGRIEEDLFGEGVRVLDPELLAKLVLEADAAEAERIMALCTRPVTQVSEAPGDWRFAVRPEREWPSPEMEEMADALRDEKNTAADDGDDDAYDRAMAALDALLGKRFYMLPPDCEIVMVMREHGPQFYRTTLPGVEAKEESEGEEQPAKPAISQRALDALKAMRRERLVDRMSGDMAVYADAPALFAFIVARTSFMGTINYETRGLTTVEQGPWREEDWMNEPDQDKAWQLFRAKKDHAAIIRDMIPLMTQGSRAEERSPYVEWLASLSKPVVWVSSEEFWELFNKKQINAMLEPVAPTWVKRNMGVTQGELRRQAHRLCLGGIDPKITGIPEEELAAVVQWVPEWLRFKDEAAA